MKVTLWSPFNRNSHYNDLRHWQLFADLSPCANNTTQKATKGKRDTRTNLCFFDTLRIAWKTEQLCVQSGYLTGYYPIRWASFTIQIMQESSGGSLLLVTVTCLNVFVPTGNHIYFWFGIRKTINIFIRLLCFVLVWVEKYIYFHDSQNCPSADWQTSHLWQICPSGSWCNKHRP